MEPAYKLATYEDVLNAPPHMVAERIDDALELQPRPASRHAFGGTALGGDLYDGFYRGRSGPGGWWILFEPELHLLGGTQIVVPDLAGWRRERMPNFPDVAYFELAPDWVCEVLSPSTQALDRGPKKRIYRQAGVNHLWFLDVLEKRLEVYQLESSRWVEIDTFEGDAKVRAVPFDAIELDMSTLWPPIPTER